MSSVSAKATPPDALLAGRYRVEERLAEGSASTILRATDLQSTTPVAVKLHTGVERSSFLREAAGSLSLQHPLLCFPLDAIYMEDGQACLIFEYFPLGTLRDALEAQGAMPEEEVVQILLDLADALAYLHARDIIHCDIKPENIFVRQGRERLEYVLGDLGAACTVREAREGNHRTGSPAYTAPERFHDRFETRSDLYSVGITAFELLTGELPFLGSPAEIARAHLRAPLPADALPEGFQRDLVHSLTAKRPADRLASAQALKLYVVSRTQGSLADLVPLPALAARHKQGVWRAGRIRPVASHELGELPEALYLMNPGDGEPVLVCEYPGRIELVSPNSGRSRSVPCSGPIRILSHDRLLYVIDGTLYELSVIDASRRRLCECGPKVLDVSASGAQLFWRTPRSGHLMDLGTQEEASFVAPHYLLAPCSTFLAGGAICTSEGAMNDQLVIRDRLGRIRKQASFDGPIVGITSGRSVVLAVTMNMNGSSERYHVWEVSEYAGSELAELPSQPTSYALTAGHVFVVDERGVLAQVVIGLVSREIMRLPEAADQLAVTTDHALLAITRGRRVDIYGNTGMPS